MSKQTSSLKSLYVDGDKDGEEFKSNEESNFRKNRRTSVVNKDVDDSKKPIFTTASNPNDDHEEKKAHKRPSVAINTTLPVSPKGDKKGVIDIKSFGKK